MDDRLSLSRLLEMDRNARQAFEGASSFLPPEVHERLESGYFELRHRIAEKIDLVLRNLEFNGKPVVLGEKPVLIRDGDHSYEASMLPDGRTALAYVVPMDARLLFLPTPPGPADAKAPHYLGLDRTPRPRETTA